MFSRRVRASGSASRRLAPPPADESTEGRFDIEGLDGGEPTLYRPCPKGGPSKAFRVPLSAAVADLLRRRAENELLFPS
jgi:hypothetical protein